MTESQQTDPRKIGAAPPPPRLGSAEQHRQAAESAAHHRDFDRAVRERFRAVLRGMEQRDMLEVRRSRTARETPDEASTVLSPELADELRPAAASFDEVVYGGRRATEDEYRRIELADRYSAAAPPPAPEPVEDELAEQSPRHRRRRGRLTPPPIPQWLRDPKLWIGVLVALVLALLIWGLLHLGQAPSAPTPPTLPKPPTEMPPLPKDFGDGSDSIFSRLPAALAFGALQLLIAAGVLAWWRGRRRGALVGEPRPVEVAAGELLAGQAGLYRRSRDYEHIAGKLRAATLRRLRPVLGMAADAPPDRLVATIAARAGAHPDLVGTALYGPVPDPSALRLVAAQLDWIESEI
ncbi:DUF4129 domain-containing protein [Nocardia panacis]|uniref:DUF4129 domain-containing protein n=1 Tax=Nocardia panacis TaxID=2340916 RepID=A0A3A4KAX7_9NOCA|nr:DUF4129 domain-containing protein [Nocardia panacis]RJO77040.1 DUF4129 domain-containing protein [Nocardia panacis]